MFIKTLITASTVAALFCSPSFAQIEGAAGCSSSPVIMTYGEHATCTVSSPSNIDIYRFFGEMGDPVLITLAGASNDLDVKFEVFDPFGTPIFSSVCSAPWNGTCSTAKTEVLPITAEYTILVSDSGQNNTGTYVLDLQRIPPTVPERYLQYNTPHTVGVGHRGDRDFMSFEGSAGDMVRVSVSGLSNDLDCAYVLYDPAGEVFDSLSCSAPWNGTCSMASPNLVLPLSGTYNLMLSDAGANNTGNLSVTVTCLLGTCPPNWETVGTNYCTAIANSTTSAAVMSAWGSVAASDQALDLYCSNVPQNQPGIFFMGQNQVELPFGNGNRCVGGQLLRLGVTNSFNRAQFRQSLDFNNLPSGAAFLPTETWNFQCWFRDPAAGGAAFNLSGGLSVTFQ